VQLAVGVLVLLLYLRWVLNALLLVWILLEALASGRGHPRRQSLTCGRWLP